MGRQMVLRLVDEALSKRFCAIGSSPGPAQAAEPPISSIPWRFQEALHTCSMVFLRHVILLCWPRRRPAHARGRYPLIACCLPCPRALSYHLLHAYQVAHTGRFVGNTTPSARLTISSPMTESTYPVASSGKRFHFSRRRMMMLGRDRRQ